MVTSRPAAAHRLATRWAWSSEPPASGSSRSRQATICTRSSADAATAARSPSSPAAAARSGPDPGTGNRAARSFGVSSGSLSTPASTVSGSSCDLVTPALCPAPRAP